jgi:hypothetical protein
MTPQTPSAPAKEWLTAQETQRFLGISKPTFFRWRDRGLIRCAKLEGRIYVKRQDLLDTLEAHLAERAPGDGATVPVPDLAAT